MAGAVLLYALVAANGATSSEREALQHLQLGNAHYGAGNLEEARAQYGACLHLAPERTDCTINLASVLHDIDPELNEGMSVQLYRRVLLNDPAHPDAAFNLGLILQDQKTEDATREAAALYRITIEAEATRWDAWANLASALSEIKEDAGQTIMAYQRAIVLIEAEQQQSSQRGTEEDEERFALDTHLATLYYGLGMALAGLSPMQCYAVAALPQILLVGSDEPQDGEHNLCLENAQNALRTTLTIDPENAQAEHMLASIISTTTKGEGSLSKASPQFVKALFDDFSNSFDTTLAALKYNVPKLLGEAAAALVRTRGYPFHSAFDAGCGTGLAGIELRHLVSGSLVGVDLSPKMLEVAAALPHRPRAARGAGGGGGGGELAAVYDSLLSTDLLQLRKSGVSPEGVELVTAADVLVYFGELYELLEVFSSLCASGAYLIFTCERLEEEESLHGWRLTSSGRFAHTRSYVEGAAIAVGFRSLSYEEVVPRMEGETPVQGHLFVFQLD